MTRYSLCATHYNGGEYLDESVSALASQIAGKNDWELVITDAGSTDGSLEYLRKLESNQTNVRIFVESGINIGAGRQLAAEKANGEVLIQIGDLDADLYTDQLDKIANFYEELLESEGDIELSISGAMICTKTLLDEIGGWRSLEVAEERELDRRFLSAGKLRYSDIKLIRENYGNEKSSIEKIRRTIKVYQTKMVCGVSPFWLFYELQRTGTFSIRVARTAIWISAVLLYLCEQESYESYDSKDRYSIDLGKRAREDHPEIVISPPSELKDSAALPGPELNQ